jgi:hypothetical protein
MLGDDAASVLEVFIRKFRDDQDNHELVDIISYGHNCFFISYDYMQIHAPITAKAYSVALDSLKRSGLIMYQLSSIHMTLIVKLLDSEIHKLGSGK